MDSACILACDIETVCSHYGLGFEEVFVFDSKSENRDRVSVRVKGGGITSYDFTLHFL